jgi:hypothetical protein
MRVLFLKTEIYLSYFFDPKRGHCSAPHYAPRLEHQERRQRCRRSVGLREWRQIIGACATDLGTASAVPFPVAKPGRPPYFFFWPCLSVLAASLSRVSRVRGFCRSLPARLSSSFDGGLFLAAISYLTSRNSVPKSLRSLMKRITRSVILDVGRGNRRSYLGVATMAETYKPGDIVPRSGTVECTQFNGTRDDVIKGTKFAPCDHWGDHHGKGCTWQYV